MYYFIVNPSSRSGKGLQVWQQAEAELEKNAVEYRVFFTSEKVRADQLAKEITRMEGYQTLVALGGDGTVNEVINGIQNFEQVTFAYIPSGSSNDFARSLKLPTDPVEAVQNILNPKYYAKLDLGEASFDEQKRLFAVSCGMGFDAAVCHEAMTSKLKKILNKLGLGKLTYVAIALHQLIALPARPITLFVDKLKTSFPKTFFVSVQNCAYEGGGLKLCPKARPDDGNLDVCAVKALNKLVLACVLPTGYVGKHTIFSCVKISQGKEIEMKAPTALALHMDGEPCGYQTDLSIRCLPGKLKMITGK